MIVLKSKKDCTGCEACVQICPKRCIGMSYDTEGFSYPVVDTQACIDCSLCEKVCPVIMRPAEPGANPKRTLAVWNKNKDIRRASSSGGVFTALAEHTIAQGGIVFGARWSGRWEVEHAYAADKAGLEAFRCSKYVQSRIGESFTQVQTFLKEGKKVLFSGTPCQVAGLRLFLRRDYENLLTVDFICHGTPSPGVWSKYRDTLTDPKNEVLTGINFRDKTEGWKHFRFAYTKRTGDGRESPCTEPTFLRGFLSDLYLRPSCHACPVRDLRSGSDLTLADFWGIEVAYPSQDDDKGHSLVLLNSVKGVEAYETALSDLDSFEVPFETVKRYNKAISSCVLPHRKRTEFFDGLAGKGREDIRAWIESCLRVSSATRIRRSIRRIAGKVYRTLLGK